ncbi:hypothetical protein IFM89_015969 [Coptis chinensis]|uniref:Uncharacterized protein n=1 Tax=Coptis chinensis TaxID=261450 RepID=A0A835HV66_9MAGN|nr:hypothetical protein IFM89_015969 [Coptis chinensis]
MYEGVLIRRRLKRLIRMLCVLIILMLVVKQVEVSSTYGKETKIFLCRFTFCYIAEKLPWIQYHELTEAGHMFPYDDGIGEKFLRALLLGMQ